MAFRSFRNLTSSAIAAALCVAGASVPVAAQERAEAAARAVNTYADLVALAEAADLVVHARVTDQAQLKPERARGVAPGFARLYVEADTRSLIAGSTPLGESLKYLVDVPLDAKGRAPKLKKSEVILFARPVPGRPAELQLVEPTAQIAWSPATEQQLRPILSALLAPDAPPQIVGVRDALSVRGNLVGESETQIFLNTAGEGPVSLSVVRRPGMEPVWGVSWTEIVDQSARPPQRDTLEWYRLACFLPEALPTKANLSREPASRARAAADYQFVLEQLGPCTRNRG